MTLQTYDDTLTCSFVILLFKEVFVSSGQ